MIEQCVKSRVALKHTCGKEPAEWLPSNQGNQYGCKQTLTLETLEEMKDNLDPEDFDRLMSTTEHWYVKNYGFELNIKK